MSRKATAKRAARAQASGSSPFTWKIGAWTILATSVGYTLVRAETGDVVKPTWLLITRCTVPPVRYPESPERLKISATTPWPAKAASPWTSTERIGKLSARSRIAAGVPSVGGAIRSCFARTIPSTTGLTASRCDGFEAILTGIETLLSPVKMPSAPLWYLTSPEPCTLSGSKLPSNSEKISR